jgi:hypothetical protein
MDPKKVYFQKQFETKNLLDFNDWVLNENTGSWQITSGNAFLSLSSSQKALDFLPNRSLRIRPSNNGPVVLSINGIETSIDDGGDDLSFHARVKCLNPISSNIKIFRLSSDSFSEKFSVSPSERWSIIRAQPIEVPISNQRSVFSIEITFADHQGKDIFLALPTAYLEYAFVRNPVLREALRQLPEIFLEIDSEQTDPTNPMLRLFEIASAWGGYSEKLRQQFRYLDIETAQNENLQGFKSALVDPAATEERFLPWLAQFTGIFLLGSRTATTAWGSLPPNWDELLEVDDFTSIDIEIISISRDSEGLVTAVVDNETAYGLEVGDIVLVYGTSDFNVTPDDGGVALISVTNEITTSTLQWFDAGDVASESAGYVNFVEWKEIEEFGAATAGLSEYWRWQIETHYNGYQAGTVEAIKESAKFFLTGEKFCEVKTHVANDSTWEDRWNITVKTLVNETPGGTIGSLSSPVVLDAVSKTKPAGFVLNHSIVPVDYDENAYAYITFTQSQI